MVQYMCHLMSLLYKSHALDWASITCTHAHCQPKKNWELSRYFLSSWIMSLNDPTKKNIPNVVWATVAAQLGSSKQSL